MTISTTTSRVSYGGNGATTAFSFPYRFFENADLVVELVDAAGAVTTHVLNTDYTVTGADLDAGGTVTMITPPSSGERLVIRRVVEVTQETDYISGDPFPAESHERALDRLTMLVQQNQEALTRTLQLPPTSDADASAINVEAVEVVAGIAADVSAVAAIDDEIEDVFDNLPAILDAPTQAGIATTQAGIATTQAGIATTQAGNAAASAALIALPLATTSGGTGASYAGNAALFAGIKQAASTSATGVVELATVAEVRAGTDVTRAVTPSGLAASVLGGVGQSLQDLTGSRALSTNYTNTTGYPIFVHVRCTTTAGSGVGNRLQLFAGAVSVGGVVSPGTGAGYGSSVSLVVPPGVSYAAAMPDATLVEWKEIR